AADAVDGSVLQAATQPSTRILAQPGPEVATNVPWAPVVGPVVSPHPTEPTHADQRDRAASSGLCWYRLVSTVKTTRVSPPSWRSPRYLVAALRSRRPMTVAPATTTSARTRGSALGIAHHRPPTGPRRSRSGSW